MGLKAVSANRYGHGGHQGHGNSWIAPAIITGVIVRSAIYGVTKDDESDNRQYRRELTRHEIQEEQLRQRECEIERRENDYYERQGRGNNDDNFREYYRDDGRSSYYSKNCW
ncbi:MAG: hypothetical protein WCJ11_05420 [Methylococcaceae bacterium]